MRQFLLPLRAACLFAAVLAASCLTAQELTFARTPWEMRVDEQTGSLLALRWNGKVIVANPTGTPLVNWGPKWTAGTPSAPVRLLSHEWREDRGELLLRTAIGEYAIDEKFTFGCGGDPDLLALSVGFTYSPADPQNAEPVKFKRVKTSWPILKKGRYLQPWVRNFLKDEDRGDLSKLNDGTVRNSAECAPPLLIEQEPDRTVIFMPEYRQDIPDSSIRAERGGITVQVGFAASGWAYPGVTQHIGPVFLAVRPMPLEQALRQEVWRTYDAIGLKAVEDTPEWFREGVLYSFRAGGTPTAPKALGGFTPSREEMIPRLKQLGFSVIWLLPVEDGNRPYWPRDYYKVCQEYGTAEELKALVDAAHEAGIRMLFDVVPHGGKPEYGELRGNKPWDLAYRENGKPDSYWCFDFGSPSWQEYIAGVTRHYMSYGIDGVRIDAVSGSNYDNWRRADFPAKCPDNVPEAWWDASLKENGGKMPPLPYERATLSRQQSGLGMLKRIGDAVKERRSDGAVLAEVLFIPYTQHADAIFNFRLPSTLAESAIRMPSDRYAAKVTRWLDETVAAYPRGSRFLQYFGSHDHLSPFGLAGFGTARTLIGYALMLDGVPMVSHDQDLGIGPFLKRMIAVRKALPELRRGAPRYASPAPNVLAALRTDGANSAVGLANIGPDPVNVPLKDLVSGSLQKDGEFKVWSSQSAAPLAVGRAETLRDLKVKMKPFSCQVIAFRPAAEPSPFPPEELLPAAAPVQERKAFALTEDPSAFRVTAPEYTLTVSRKDGQILDFTDASGKSLLSGAGIITEPSPKLAEEPIRPAAAVTAVSGREKIELRSESVLPGGAKITLRYCCTPQKVTVEGSIDKAELAPRCGVAFAGRGIDRWQVSGAEGLIDDYFFARHLHGTLVFPEGNKTSRLGGTPVMWEAATQPLSFEKPYLTAFSGGNGIRMEFRQLLSGSVDNIAVLDKLAGKPGWHMAVFWKDCSPYPWEKESRGRREFTFDLAPVSRLLEQPDATPWTQAGKVKFRNVSQGWEIDNGHYTMMIHRCGGSIRSLRDKSGKELLNGSRIYTDKGFRRTWGGPNFDGATDNDLETGVKVRSDGGKLYLTFHSCLRKGGWLVTPPIWSSIEYVFDGSPSIGIACSVLSEGKPQDDPVFVGWELSSDTWNWGRFFRDGRKLEEGGVLSGQTPPDRVEFCDRNGQVIATLNSIHYPTAEAAGNAVKEGRFFRISMLERAASEVQPDRRYNASLVLTVEN